MKARSALIALMGLGVLVLASADGAADCLPPEPKPILVEVPCDSPQLPPCSPCCDEKFSGPHKCWPEAEDCGPKLVVPCPTAELKCETVESSPCCEPHQHDCNDDYTVVLAPAKKKKVQKCQDPCPKPCENSCSQPKPCDNSCSSPCDDSCSSSCDHSCSSSCDNSCSSSSSCDNSCGHTCTSSCENSCHSSCEKSCGQKCVTPCEPSDQPEYLCGPDGFFADHDSLEDMEVRAKLCRSDDAFDFTNWAFYKGYKKLCCEYCTVTGSDEPICSSDVGCGCDQVPRWACDDNTPEIVKISKPKKVLKPKKVHKPCPQPVPCQEEKPCDSCKP